MRVADAHISGRFDATDEQVAKAFRRLWALGATVGGTTEARGREPEGHIRLYVPAPAYADAGILWDDRVWRAEDRGVITLYKGNWGPRAAVRLTWVLLRHRKSDKTLLRFATHLPASVQYGVRFSRAKKDRDNVRAWVLAMDALPAEVVRLQRELSPDETTLSADFNVHLGLRVWRTRVNKVLQPTGMRLIVPDKGTHHHRVIDAHASTMRPRFVQRAVRVLRRFAGLDHNSVLALLKSKRKR